MTNQEKLKERFLTIQQDLSDQKDLNPLEQELNSTAIKRFKEFGIPSNKWEAWKYTNITNFLDANISLKSVSSQSDTTEQTSDKTQAPFKYHLTFIDGEYIASKSSPPEGLEVSNELPPEHLEKLIQSTQQENNPFTLINRTCCPKTSYINVPKNFCLEEIVHIHHKSTSPEKNQTTWFPSSLFIYQQEASDLKIIESFEPLKGEQNQILKTHESFIYQEANSFLTHINISLGHDCQTAVNRFHFDVNQEARVKSFTLNLAGRATRNDISFALKQKNAFCQADGLFAISNKEHVDNFSSIQHQVAETYSSQLFKGILDQESRGVFTGRVVISRDAQKVEADQLNKNLLIGKKARINTRPQLEVYADDVKCAHGATIGQIGDEELFYLKSRAIHQKRAYHMLCQAFIADVLMRIENPTIEKYLETLVFENYQNIQDMSLNK